MLVNLNLNKNVFLGSKNNLSARKFVGMRDKGDNFTFLKENKEPGLDDKTDGTISIAQRIKNVKTYFHNAIFMRNNAYNWSKQIEEGKILKRESRDVYCEFLNLKSEARTDIYDKIQQIKRAKEGITTDCEVEFKNGSRVKFEYIDDANEHYKASLYDKSGRLNMVYTQWDNNNADVNCLPKKDADDEFEREFSFVNGELTGVQISCKKPIKDSPFKDDFVYEKVFYEKNGNLTVTYKRGTGSYFDRKFVFENKTISSIKKSSDSQARFVSEYLFKNNGLTQINVESYEDVVNHKYPVKTVKTLYCDLINQ